MRKIAVLFIVFVLGAAASVDFYTKLSDAAIALTAVKVKYDPAYVSIPYPNGDVAPDKGVCTDVVIRAYRKLGIDLQKEVHEDMVAHFELYPKIWGLKRPDASIDHRRVQNLQEFFKRHQAELKVSKKATDYQVGDLVTWDLGGGVAHIGIIVDRTSAEDPHRHMIVHNIGGGQVLSDCLFKYMITGHYRYRKSG